MREGPRGESGGLMLAGFRLPREVGEAADLAGRGFDVGAGVGAAMDVRFVSRLGGPPDLAVELPSTEAGIRIRRVEGGHEIQRFDAWTNQLALRVALADWLWDEGGLVIHASAVLESGGAVLFPGPSGAGKSTLADNAHAPRLSDDTVVVRTAGGLTAFGTPFGRPRVEGRRGAFPIRAVCFPEKADRLDVSQVSRAESYIHRLSSQVFAPPGSRTFSPRMWATMLELAEKVPAYVLRSPLGYRFRAPDLSAAASVS